MKNSLSRATTPTLSAGSSFNLPTVGVFGADAAGDFGDITGSPHAHAIVELAKAGIFKGVGGGKIDPDGTVTRAMAVTVLGRMAGAKEDESRAAQFFDVADSWYTGYVGWAVKYGIVMMDGEGRFMPNEPVTGEAMELMLSRYAKVARLGYPRIITSKAPLTWGELAEMVYFVHTLDPLPAEGPFDYSKDIAAEKAGAVLTPAASDIAVTVADAKGADGVVLVTGANGDYYLNAYVAGNALTFSASSGSIAGAASSKAGDLIVTEDGSVTVTPAPILADDPVSDEIITLTMANGSVYRVHTRHSLLPAMTVTGDTEKAMDGVYTFALDKFMLRVSSDKEIIYYRDMNCVGETLMCENFAAQEADGANWYSMFVELRSEYRNMNGGFSSGMYVLMDENYKQVEDGLTLKPYGNHGEGYLDQHDFVVLGKDHYLLLSYSKEQVSNLPATVASRKDGTAFVWAGIMQEVKDGKVIWEIDTADDPELYETAVEKIDYAGSTDQPIMVADTATGALKPSSSEGIMDYVHVNSMDYILNADGTVAKLLVSMRDQSAVYQYDTATGTKDWVLGGKGSTLSGYDEHTRERTDDNGKAFNALTFGQHHARYLNRNAEGTLTGDPVISVFDNQTGAAPFLAGRLYPGYISTLTRVFKAGINVGAKTVTLSDVIKGIDMNGMSDKYHIASHCGSVVYKNNSAVIGWGLHGVIDGLGPYVPQGTISDPSGYPDLRIGSRPVFTEYDLASGAIAFELSAVRNPGIGSHEAFFSYRTYWTET